MPVARMLLPAVRSNLCTSCSVLSADCSVGLRTTVLIRWQFPAAACSSDFHPVNNWRPTEGLTLLANNQLSKASTLDEVLLSTLLRYKNSRENDS